MCNVGSGFSPSTHRVEGENNQHIPGERSGKMMDVKAVERVAKRKAVETGDSSQVAGVAVFLGAVIFLRFRNCIRSLMR